MDGIHSYMEIPYGYSIIVQNFHYRFKCELTDARYIIINPLRNKWGAPEVFNMASVH